MERPTKSTKIVLLNTLFKKNLKDNYLSSQHQYEFVNSILCLNLHNSICE